MLLSYQGTMVPGAPGQFTTSNGNDPSYSFEVTIPTDDTYTVEWAAGYRNGGTLSKITITATDESGNVTTLGTNNNTTYVYEDMSMGGLFPWNHIPMKKMRNSVQMSAGTYTIKADIEVCQTKLYLFALDYIQFTPSTFTVPEGQTIASLIRDDNGVIDGVAISSGSDNSAGDVTASGNYAAMTDGKYDNDSPQWYSHFGQTNAYFQIDLGKAKHISKIIYRPFNNVTSGGAYWRRQFEIQASNYADFRDYEVLCNQNAEIPIETNFVLNIDPTITKYRYVRVQNNAGIKNSVIGCREIDIQGYAGEDTVIGADLVESISVADGTNGLTNVKNAKAVNPWGSAGARAKIYQDGKPIEIKFTDTTDMSLVNSTTVKLSKYDGSALVTTSYTPIIDTKNKTLKIDLSDLDAFVGTLTNTKLDNMYYQLDITDSIMSEDGTFKANPKTIKFTTNQIAKAPYVEGKEIKNVALGKSARYKTAKSSYENGKGTATPALGIGRYTAQYTNGAVGPTATTTDKTTGTYIYEGNTATKQITSVNPVLIDLGQKYKVAAIAATTSGDFNYHYWNVSHYLTNNETFDNTGLTSVWDTKKQKIVASRTAAVTSSEATRYVLVRVGDTYPNEELSQYPSEIMVYAYVNAASDNDVYFTSPVSTYTAETEQTPYSETVTITANAEDAGTSVLFLAEYEGKKMTSAVQSAVCQDGKATVSMPKSANKTYRAFLWNSLKGIIPVTEDICY